MNWKLCLCLALLYIGLGNCDEEDDAFVTTEDDDPPAAVEEEIAYASPSPSGYAYLADHFDDLESFKKKWVLSEAKKDDADEEIAKYDGEWAVEAPVKDGFNGDLGLVLKSKAKHAAISSRLKRVFEFKDKPLVVQYEVILQEGQECGGAYLKLLSDGPQTSDLRHFHDKTPYTIMFGPDKCGFDHKLHFIFRHRNPLNGTITEKHAKAPKERLEEPFKDKQPHLYTLVLKPDNTFQVSLDHKIVNEGSLLEDFTPAVNPPKEIDDPNDRKPEDWDEREKIPDPQASKPEDWDEDAPAQIPDSSATMPDGWLEDEEESIPDPNAEKPEDWDTEMDGDWEAPLVSNPACEAAAGCGQWRAPLVTNPAYKGKWRAPLIENPNYKGRWSPRRIPNPDHFEDKQPFRMTPISAVGLELWSMSNMILFDNFLVTDDLAVAEQWAADSFDLKRRNLDKQAGTMWGRVMRSINYKPGWWALYFVYCMIPISIYVWYISRRVKEETFVSRIIRYTNEQPWLWAVYVIVLAIPVVLIFVFCCGPSAEEKEEQEREADAKKTDAVSPDDEVDEEEQEQEEEEEEEEVVEKRSSPRESTPRDSSQRGPSRSKSDLDQPREETASAEEEVDVAAAGDAPRSPKKRRPRKE